MKTNILFIVEPQNDFLTGTTVVEGSIEAIKNLIDRVDNEDTKFLKTYQKVIVLLDWHPFNHISFKDKPRHCVEHSNGAALPNKLVETLSKFDERRPLCELSYLKKGYQPQNNPKTVFNETFEGSLLIKELSLLARHGGIGKISVCGININDFIEHLIERGYTNNIEILTDCIAPTDDKSLKKLINTFKLNTI